MNATELAIRNNRVTLTVVLVFILGGIGAYLSLPRAEDPGFTVRTALVSTVFPGASPERVELLVTDKIEEAVQEIPQLDFVTSESRTGVSQVFVNIKESENEMRPIWDDLRRKIEAVADDLPDGIIGPTVNDDFGDVFPVMLTITGDGLTYRELDEIAQEVRDELLRIPEVARIDVYGAQDERVFVEYSGARLSELGLSPLQLRSILESTNIIIPGGAVSTGDERIVLEPTGSFESVDDLRHAVISIPGRSEVIYLEDIATVSRGYVDPPQAMMRQTGSPCLGLSVSMRDGGNLILLGDEVRRTVRELRALYPIGLDLDLRIFQPEFVDQQVKGFVSSLLQAMGIVLLVMLVSLGPRTGLVVASLIPVTMLVTLLVMQTTDIGLDQISIAALIIALGMLVDNAIVMSESILVALEQGKDRFRAAIDSANELRIPLLTSSLTTSAAFLPIFLAESTTGEYTASLFKVVTIALLASWGLSLTMMPLLCMLFLRVNTSGDGESFDGRFYRGYRNTLVGLLRRPILSVIGVVVVFATALFGMGFVPNIFFPESDAPRMIANLDLPVGADIERTEAVIADLERFMLEELRVDPGSGEQGFLHWTTYIGRGGIPRYRLSADPTLAGGEHASILVTATGRDAIDAAIPRLETYCRENFPDLVTSFSPEALGPPVEFPVQIRLSGKESDRLFAIADGFKEKLRETPGTRNVQDDWGPRVKKLRVTVDEARAHRAGVTNQDVAISLQTILSGIETTQYREGDDVIPVTLRSVAADRKDISKLESLDVYAQSTGRTVPLRQVANLDLEWESSVVIRRDGLRTVTVSCDLAPGRTAAGVVPGVLPWLDDELARSGVGYRYEIGGEIESSGQANASIGAKLPIAFFLILLLLVSQFNSFRKTAIILLTIPLGLIGVTIGLLSAGSYFGFMTLLGVISLAGIIINNAIVLIDRIRIEIEDNGLEPTRAIVQSAQQRLRPILLTTCTTVGGLLPLWFGGGPMWQPMAIAIIFGLLFATALTLGVVPILYSLFFRVSFKGFRWS